MSTEYLSSVSNLVTMGSEIDNNGNLDDAMDVSPSGVEDGKHTRLRKEELGICKSNCEDDVFRVGIDNGVDSRGNGKELEVDVDVDVVGNVSRDECEERVMERDTQDATECSSSFGCTDSESGVAETSGDMEVESHANTMMMGFDGYSDLFGTRKKKLSDEWRKYVRPLMWRCKWVELHIRELQFQAAQYGRALAECDKRKQCELEKFSTEDHAVKSVPFIYQNRSVKLMKRKKRKRMEETFDLASYTTSHSLFSHFVKKKPGADTAHTVDDQSHAGKTPFEDGADDELPSLQFKDSDAFETILRKIEEAQVHVRQLRIRMDKVVRENADKFAEDDQLTNSDQNSLLPHVINEHTDLASMLRSQLSSKRLAARETAVSVGKEATSGMIKSIDDPLAGGQHEKIEKEVLLINNPAVKEEFTTAEDSQMQLLIESPEHEQKPEIVQHVPDPNFSSKMKMQEQPTLAMQSLPKMTFPKNNKKRGRRKARTGRWSKRSSG